MYFIDCFVFNVLLWQRKLVSINIWNNLTWVCCLPRKWELRQATESLAQDRWGNRFTTLTGKLIFWEIRDLLRICLESNFAYQRKFNWLHQPIREKIFLSHPALVITYILNMKKLLLIFFIGIGVSFFYKAFVIQLSYFA